MTPPKKPSATEKASAEIEKYVLEQLPITMSQYLDGHAMANLSIKRIADTMTDHFAYHLRTYILGEKCHEAEQTVTFRYPKNWWEHLKYSHSPKWFTRKFPVGWKHEKKTVKFEKVVCFPKIAKVLPFHEREHSFPVLKTSVMYSSDPFPL